MSERPDRSPKSQSERTPSLPHFDTSNIKFLLLSNNPNTLKRVKIARYLGIKNALYAEGTAESIDLIMQEGAYLALVDLDSLGLEPIDKIRREFPKTTIIAISNYQWDQVPNPAALALKAGADLVINSSDSLRVQLQFIDTFLRKKEPTQNQIIEIGEIQVNLNIGTVTKDGKLLMLSRKERELLSVLAKNVNRILTRNQILTEVYGEGYTDDFQLLRVIISRVRAKIGKNLIETIRGVGYKLTYPEKDPQHPQFNQD